MIEFGSSHEVHIVDQIMMIDLDRNEPRKGLQTARILTNRVDLSDELLLLPQRTRLVEPEIVGSLDMVDAHGCQSAPAVEVDDAGSIAEAKTIALVVVSQQGDAIQLVGFVIAIYEVVANLALVETHQFERILGFAAVILARSCIWLVGGKSLEFT